MTRRQQDKSSESLLVLKIAMGIVLGLSLFTLISFAIGIGVLGVAGKVLTDAINQQHVVKTIQQPVATDKPVSSLSQKIENSIQLPQPVTQIPKPPIQQPFIVKQEDTSKQDILRKIKYNWLRPEGIEPGLTAKYHVSLSSDGGVLSVNTVDSSGDISFDQSGFMAIRRASPLPVHKHGGVSFDREMEIVFSPDKTEVLKKDSALQSENDIPLAIRNKVKNYWIRPLNAIPGLKCTIKMQKTANLFFSCL